MLDKPIMDRQSPPLNGNSQRRKLIKRPPSHQPYGRSSSGYDTESLDGNSSSSRNLRRAPSAPPVRSTASNASSGSPRPHPSSFQQRTNASPDLASARFRLSDPNQSRGNEDLIGAPFDGTSILNHIEAIKLGSHIQQPPSLVKAATDPRFTRPSPTTSPSYAAMDQALEKPQPGRVSDSLMSPKRFSDETKEAKPTTSRKKSGFSGFVNSLVGSQKKPVISAPENPVHVTHVGYDSTTGQFTVSPIRGDVFVFIFIFIFIFILWGCCWVNPAWPMQPVLMLMGMMITMTVTMIIMIMNNNANARPGTTQRMAAAHQRKWHLREGEEREPSDHG